MLKEFVWKTFEKTGDVDYYIFYRDLEKNGTGICNDAVCTVEPSVLKDVSLPV